MIAILPDHDPSARVSEKLALFTFKTCSLEDMERILKRDANMCITSANMIEWITRHYLSEEYHREIASLLRKHPGRYSMSEDVKTAVDEEFVQRKDEKIKKLCYELAGW